MAVANELEATWFGHLQPWTAMPDRLQTGQPASTKDGHILTSDVKDS